MSEKGKLYIVTDRSRYEGSILVGTGDDHGFRAVRCVQDGEHLKSMDGERLDLHEVAVRKLSRREVRKMAIDRSAVDREMRHFVRLWGEFDAEVRTHRMRRGKLVEIPEEWRGRLTTRKTIRDRQSKHTRKLRVREGAASRRYPSRGMHPRNLAPRHRSGARVRCIEMK
jgi:hypothetical protein